MTTSHEGTGQSIWLRRDGARPLNIDGLCMVEAGNWQPEQPFWYEIAIYQLSDGGFAASRKTFFKQAEFLDGFAAVRASSADDVVDWLKAHDAARDLPQSVAFDELEAESKAGAELDQACQKLEAWREEQIARLGDIRQSYQSLLEQVLP